MSILFASDYVLIPAEPSHEILFLDHTTTSLYQTDKSPIIQSETVKPETTNRVDRLDQRDIPLGAYQIVNGGSVDSYTPSSHYKSTIGVAFKMTTKIHLGNGVFAKAQLWDTAGQERFRSISISYYRGADVVVVVYDVTEEVSEVERWIDDALRTSDTLNVVVIGNKIDLKERRMKNFEEVNDMCMSRNIYHAEMSAHSGEGIEEAFNGIMSAAYLNAWSNNRSSFDMTKIVVAGDSGVGKTTIFDRLETFDCDLSPLVLEFPLDFEDTSVLEVEKSSSKANDDSLYRKKVPTPDTNIIAMNLGHLSGWLGDVKIATGDPQFCESCSAIFNPSSVVQSENNGEGIWECEFCSTENTIFTDEETLLPEVDYILSGTPRESMRVLDGSVLIFCIDVSGSMCVSSEMSKREYEKSIFSRKKKSENLQIGQGDATSQYLPHEKKNVMYVSRLDSVKASIEAQLIDLQQDHPNRKVVLVTFSDVVTVYTNDNLPVIIQGDMLSNRETLSDISRWWKKNSFDFPAVVSSREFLSDSLFNLEEGGQTALGPALYVCSLLSENISAESSKIVICTDGLANIGIGNMEESSNDQLYEDLGKKFLANDTVVSLLSFDGSDCNIESLGEMVKLTGGQVDIVNPVTIEQNLHDVFSDDTIATQVEVKLLMPTGCYLSQDTQNDNWTFVSENVYTNFIGSVNSDSNFLFHFEVDPNEIQLDSLLQFQIQIRYTRVEDGSTLLRCITKSIEPTTDRRKTEKHSDPEAVALFSIRNVARTAQLGYYSLSRLQNATYFNMMQRITDIACENKKKDTKYSFEEVKTSFLSYAKLNHKFEHRIMYIQRGELHAGQEWDETETRDSDKCVVEDKGLLSSFKSLFSKSDTSQVQKLQEMRISTDVTKMMQVNNRVKNRQDSLANYLWNLRIITSLD